MTSNATCLCIAMKTNGLESVQNLNFRFSIQNKAHFWAKNIKMTIFWFFSLGEQVLLLTFLIIFILKIEPNFYWFFSAKKIGITFNCALVKVILSFEYPTWSLNIERIINQCSFCLISEDVNGSVPTLVSTYIQVTKKQVFFSFLSF